MPGLLRVLPLTEASPVGVVWIHTMLRVLLTVCASVFVRIGPLLRREVLEEYSRTCEAAQGLLNDLVGRVLHWLKTDLRPRWQAPGARGSSLMPRQPSAVSRHIVPTVDPPLLSPDDTADRLDLSKLARTALHALNGGMDDQTTPWNILLVPWGAGDVASVKPTVALDAVACEGGWRSPDHPLKAAYTRLWKHHLSGGHWSPHPELVRIDGSTDGGVHSVRPPNGFLPTTELATPAPQEVKRSPIKDPLTGARDAAYRLLFSLDAS